MAVVVKDVKTFPKDAPTELLLEKNKDFIAKYGKSEETHYEFVMAEFLRINGVYWSNTALYLMGGAEELNTKEVNEAQALGRAPVDSVVTVVEFPIALGEIQ